MNKKNPELPVIIPLLSISTVWVSSQSRLQERNQVKAEEWE